MRRGIILLHDEVYAVLAIYAILYEYAAEQFPEVLAPDRMYEEGLNGQSLKMPNDAQCLDGKKP